MRYDPTPPAQPSDLDNLKMMGAKAFEQICTVWKYVADAFWRTPITNPADFRTPEQIGQLFAEASADTGGQNLLADSTAQYQLILTQAPEIFDDEPADGEFAIPTRYRDAWPPYDFPEGGPPVLKPEWDVPAAE